MLLLPLSPLLRISLDSDRGTGDNANKKKYILSRSIEVPPNFKALVYLESFFCPKPRLFHPEYYQGSALCVQTNTFQKHTNDACYCSSERSVRCPLG
jgi:hypothetical protein